jgi:cellulose synthase/poly-beta-1,6-N-acetylglucosamine synthase-like glycosyltransferase
MFSVVIPLYNKERYIRKALLSVFGQTFTAYEVIIINDGSTDGSKEIVAELSSLSHKPIRIIDQKNQGVSAARNTGVIYSNFEHIAFLDADDWWEPEFLHEMKKLIHDFPEAGIYGSSFRIVKETGVKLPEIGVQKGFQRGYINYFKTYLNTFNTPFNCSFVVVQKTAFNKVDGFNTHLRYGEDLDLWVRLALNFKMAYINYPLAFSNQDFSQSHRALGNRLWLPQENYIFNLDYLQKRRK